MNNNISTNGKAICAENNKWNIKAEMVWFWNSANKMKITMNRKLLNYKTGKERIKRKKVIWVTNE